jgi:hypothetical protein
MDVSRDLKQLWLHRPEILIGTTYSLENKNNRKAGGTQQMIVVAALDPKRPVDSVPHYTIIPSTLLKCLKKMWITVEWIVYAV